MYTVRKSADRGHANHGWLDSRHTFSFSDYQDERHMGFRALRVINEDIIAAGAGFPTHPHRDMEILTFVVSGAIAHKDSTGGEGVIRPGEVQRMSAGTGVQHSEFNPSKTDPTHLLQIWLLPEAVGLKPGYEQKAYVDRLKDNSLVLIAARDGREGAVTIQQDVDLYAGKLKAGEAVRLALRKGRGAWLQMIKGSSNSGGHALSAGDALAIANEPAVEIWSDAEAEFLLFDLP